MSFLSLLSPNTNRGHLSLELYLVLLLCVQPLHVLSSEPFDKGVIEDEAMSEDEARRPNVLLLLADDLGYNDSPLYQALYEQEPVAPMPALMGLAAEGVRYSRFYTESTCSSSRAGLLSGQYPARNGFAPAARGLSTDIITLPEFLQAQGYRTHHVGKWHVGEIHEEASPLQQGFDSSFGFLGQWFLKGPDKQGQTILGRPSYRNPWLVDAADNLQTYQAYSGHLTDLLLERTLELIEPSDSILSENDDSQPWFIYHAFFSPHTPLQPAERFSKQYPDTPAGRYQALLAQLDFSLAAMMDKLKQSGQWDNTLIIFASDNGATAKHVLSNAPFVGGKNSYEEGGVRAPLVVKWPKSMNAIETSIPNINRTNKQVVSILDIYPSIMAFNNNKKVNEFVDIDIDGRPTLFNNNSVSEFLSRQLFFLSYTGLSVLDTEKNIRYSQGWDYGNFTPAELWSYDDGDKPYRNKNVSHEYRVQNDSLYQDFIIWRNDIRSVPIIFTPQKMDESSKSNKAGEISLRGKATGRDFLRSPVNSAFSVALSFKFSSDIDESVDNTEVLLSQKGALDLTWQTKNKKLTAKIHGQELSVSLNTEATNLEKGCHTAILSGAFRDRFSGFHPEAQQSQVSLVVDGELVDEASFTLSDLNYFPIDTPTYVGYSSQADNAFSGQILDVQFYNMQILPNDKPVESGIETVIQSLCSKAL